MTQHLFNPKTFKCNSKAFALEEEVKPAFRAVIDKYVAAGYSARQVSHVIIHYIQECEAMRCL